MRTITDLHAAFADLEEIGREHLAELAHDALPNHVTQDRHALLPSGTAGTMPPPHARRPVRRWRIAAPWAAAALVAATVVSVLATTSGSRSDQSGGFGAPTWSTAPIVTHPSWQCPSGQKPTSVYRVGIDDHGPTGLQSIAEECTDHLGFSPLGKIYAVPTQQMVAGNTVSVTVEPAGAFTPPAPAGTWQRVTVNGVIGYYDSTPYRGTPTNFQPATATLYWAYAPHAYVVIATDSSTVGFEHGQRPVPAATLVAVAESGMWRGQTASVPLRLSAAPTGTILGAVLTYTTADLPGLADLFFFNRTSGQSLDVSLTTTPFSTAASAGTPTTVAGHPAAIAQDGTELDMQAGDATIVVAWGNVGNPVGELARVAATVTTAPNPTDRTGWYSIATAVPGSCGAHGC
jgi:hypothetical protein